MHVDWAIAIPLRPIKRLQKELFIDCGGSKRALKTPLIQASDLLKHLSRRNAVRGVRIVLSGGFQPHNCVRFTCPGPIDCIRETLVLEIHAVRHYRGIVLAPEVLDVVGLPVLVDLLPGELTAVVQVGYKHILGNGLADRIVTIVERHSHLILSHVR